MKKQLEKDFLPRKQKYERQTEITNGRNSYSKTDHDATFMRMKDDHMKNGQLKAGYNIQIGTEKQFITGFSIHQRAGDPRCLIPHLDCLKQYRPLPSNVIADSAYGSEENYSHLEESELTAYIPFNTFEKEKTRKWKKEIGRVENMEYDEQLDEFICANNQKRLTFQAERKRTLENGYVSVQQTYRCTECIGSPFQEKCAKGKDQKSIYLSLKNVQQRQKIRERLHSEEGKDKYSQRKIDVETAFGQTNITKVFNAST